MSHYTLPPKADCTLCNGAGLYSVRTYKYGTNEELEPITCPCSCTIDWKAVRRLPAPVPDCDQCNDTGVFYDAWYDNSDDIVQTDRPCPYCNEGAKRQMMQHAKHHLIHDDTEAA